MFRRSCAIYLVAPHTCVDEITCEIIELRPILCSCRDHDFFGNFTQILRSISKIGALQWDRSAVGAEAPWFQDEIRGLLQNKSGIFDDFPARIDIGKSR
jgi:hypothetical protein